jgi:large-conductance mechanosensitive channel
VTKDLFNLIIAALYIFMIVGAGVFLSWMTIQKRKNKERMRANIVKKLTANVTLSAKDIFHIGRGFDLSSQGSRDVVFKLYADVDDPASFSTLKALVAEIEKEEPFDELPDEVKPSLSRLSKLIEQSDDSADKHILLPLTTTLTKYVELKVEQEKAKKQTNRAYVITIISFVVGAISFYFTLKSPSEADMKKVMEQVLSEKASNVPLQK